MFPVKTLDEHDLPGCAQMLKLSDAQSGRRSKDGG